MTVILGQDAALMFILSFIGVLTISVIYWLLIRGQKARFWDIIREKDWEPSLSRFQLLIWTWIVLFSFFGVFAVKAFAGEIGFPEIPRNLLILMGISVAPAVISSAYNRHYGVATENKRAKPPALARMLMESVKNKEGQLMEERSRAATTGADYAVLMKPSVTRFQMFVWTFIAVTAYLVILFSVTADNLSTVENLALPDAPEVMLILMGISQGAYVTGKLASV